MLIHPKVAISQQYAKERMEIRQISAANKR